ncbi:MAG: helix-turn-helix domain-containing protein, partial [Candidatus Uhrbacteria bacterium]|nr:helix-turn-helix domain-containing protein [Candidatus Uhrbacteria bacterium]
MKYKIQSFLDRIGLSHQEAVLYVTALEMGASSVAQLAKRAGIHRVEAYALTAKLLQRGLARQTLSKGRKLFEAQHPRQLEQLIAG